MGNKVVYFYKGLNTDVIDFYFSIVEKSFLKNGYEIKYVGSISEVFRLRHNVLIFVAELRHSIYNPQNEMFRHFRTKCSISQNETYLRESFSLPINQIKKHRKNLLLRCFFIACLFGYLAKIH